MNPHFLFNAMEAIQSFMIHNDTKEASLYLTEFARLTRSVITHTREETITLENEIEALTSYLKLQQLLKNNTFQFNILLDEDLEPEFMYIPPMLIQPFIENAIKHGLKDQMPNGKIELRITDRKNSIDVELSDNGVGYESSPKKKSGHISYAMQIFEERRKIIRQNTGKNIKFTIENMTQKGHENGTRIFLNIPVFES
jgi:LytS/YehU family sensor histidine kinase